MSSSALLRLPLLVLLCAAAAAPPSSAARVVQAGTAEADEAVFPLLADTVHDLLPQYGLPRGLLPASVTSYSMDQNGHFVVELAGPCYVQFTDLVYYGRTVKGKLSYGAITDISGIQVKKLFAWLSITGMVADPDGKAIEFQVGFISEKLPASLFAEIPTCRNKASVGGAPCHDAERGAADAAEAA